MTTNEIVGRLKEGGLDASSTNRSAAVYVTEARSGRAEPGWFAFRIICDSEATERRVRSILSRWYDIDASGGVWRLRAKNRVPLMAIKRGGVPPTPPTPTGDYMYFEAAQANSTIALSSSIPTAPNIEYSTDGVNWQMWHYTDQQMESITLHVYDVITLTSVGDRVYVRGENAYLNKFDFEQQIYEVTWFDFTGKLNSGGNITSVIDGDGLGTSIPDYGIGSLFFFLLGQAQDYIPLLTPPSLGNVTSVGVYGLFGTFGGCGLLTSLIDMSNVTSFGESAISAMYVESDLQLISDGVLTFGFPQLPVNVGSTILSTAQDVADYMSDTPF